MAKDHGSSVKNDKQYEGLRKKGMSKSRAAAIANTSNASSKGGNKSDTSTRAGKRNAAICATEFLTTEMARSLCPLAASTTPTTFSTALPAIATITSPANACEMPSDSIAGSSAATNQSDAKAAPAPATASSTI